MKRLLLFAMVALMAGSWGSTARGGSTPANTINELIAAAQPGDTITVPAGLYKEHLVIDKAITLEGAGWPVIDAGGVGDVIRVNAADVTIRGFVIQGSSIDVSDEPAGIRVAANNSRIEGNRIQNVLYGIELQDSGGHIVRNNSISSIVRFGAERRGHGIYLWHTNDNVVADNTIENVKDGFFVGFSTRNAIENNHVTKSRYGIHYMYSNDNEFHNNVFRDNIAGGVLMYSTDITFTGNEFAYNKSAASGYGLLFKDMDNVLMSGNYIHHNRLGITMEGAPSSPAAFVTLKGNLIAFNQAGLELTTTTAATFTENTFTGNLEQVISRGGSQQQRNAWSLNGRGNYWDDYQGYDANGDGVGDIKFSYDGSYDALVQENQALKAFAFTPARSALDLAGGWFPAFKPATRLIDDHPLMSPSITLSAEASRDARLSAAVAALLLVVVPLVAMRGTAMRFGKWSKC
ncbi:MAG: nitrous oxide reductase family maturation protein NosD [Tepidiformaceae bacterium]